MKIAKFLCAAIIGCFCTGAYCQSPDDDDMFLADPTVANVDGKFYMAGTQVGSPQGFTVYVSDDLETWKSTSPQLPNLVTGGEGIYGEWGFWAPQFVQHNGKSYIFYCANEQIAFASSDKVDGRYSGGRAIDTSEKNIDPFLFTDTDGKHYLYHVRFDHGNFLWVGEFDFDSGSFVEGTLKPVFKNDQAWEHTGAYPSSPIMEGPTVIRLRDTYYLFYSANHFMSPDYAVGYATAPTPMGPWTKYEGNPIIHKRIVGENGSGHGDVFADNKGKMYYVFHTHFSDSVVPPRRTRIIPLVLEKSKSGDAPFIVKVNPKGETKPHKAK